MTFHFHKPARHFPFPRKIFKKEKNMATTEIAFLALVVGALALFGGTLAWASWDESRRKGR